MKKKIEKYICMICSYENLNQNKILNNMPETHTEYIITDTSKNYFISLKVDREDTT